MSDDMREVMVAALAADLGIDTDRAMRALNAMWEATKDVPSPHPLSYRPDESSAAVMLAHRIEHAIYDAVAADEADAAIVVVQEARTRDIGLAIIGLPAGEAEFLLRLGIGSLRRGMRLGGLPPSGTI